MPNPNFTSKPYLQFIDFHVNLNKYVKLSTSSIDFLSNSTKDVDELNNSIENLIVSAGERWGEMKYIEPFEELKLIRLQLAQSSIMWVFSSFEVFLNLVHSSLSKAIVNPERVMREEDNESIRLKELFRKFSWETENINYLIPLFDFYSLARHCIVHNMGYANQELKNIANSSEFIKAIENWPTVSPGKKLSPPPEIDSNGYIVLRPHHAITYSDICYRISKIVNENILETVGLEYFVLKIVKEKLLGKSTIIEPACKDLYAYIKFHLRAEYNLENIETPILRSILEENGNRKNCVAKYNALKK